MPRRAAATISATSTTSHRPAAAVTAVAAAGISESERAGAEIKERKGSTTVVATEAISSGVPPPQPSAAEPVAALPAAIAVLGAGAGTVAAPSSAASTITSPTKDKAVGDTLTPSAAGAASSPLVQHSTPVDQPPSKQRSQPRQSSRSTKRTVVNHPAESALFDESGAVAARLPLVYRPDLDDNGIRIKSIGKQLGIQAPEAYVRWLNLITFSCVHGVYQSTSCPVCKICPYRLMPCPPTTASTCLSRLVTCYPYPACCLISLR